ncbi:MAG: ArnT family glycosyltransferase [Pyrinomonadaceae bacterium]
MKIENQSSSKKLTTKYQLVILFTGIALPLILVFLTRTDSVVFSDAVDYLAVAESLIAGNGFPLAHSSLPFFRAPLYPIFISIIWLVFPKSILAILIVQSVIFGLTALLLAKLAFLIFGNKLIAFLSGIIYCFNPFTLISATDVQTECLHTFLFLAGVFLLVKSNRLQNGILSLLIGLIWGIASLCRPSALPVALALFGVIFLLNIRKNPLIKSAKSFLLILGLFLAIIPWTALNFYKTGEFILINDAGGFALWLGNHPMSIKFYDGSIKTPEEYTAIRVYLIGPDGAIQEQLHKFEQTTGYYNLSLREREKLWQNEAFNSMSESPGRTFRLFIRKFWDYWRPYLLPNAYSTRMVAASLIYFSALYFLAFLGGINLFKIEDGKYYLTLLLSIFLASTTVHVIIISMIRRRLPYIEPYLTVLAMSGVWGICAKISKLIKSNRIFNLENKI